MMDNPFPGPQPYPDGDKRFFGRDPVAASFASTMLVQRCVTLHGPSGAGKSSLMAAKILPLARERGYTTVIVDRWPDGESPVDRLRDALSAHLGQGAPPPASPSAALEAMEGERVFVFLDQLDRLLQRDRKEHVRALVRCLAELLERPAVELHVVLGIREDYLGRWREQVRGHRRLVDNWLRLHPLSVAEIAKAVCDAARLGAPEQKWSLEVMRRILVDVRAQREPNAPPGYALKDADLDAACEEMVEAAYAQIVCRALFEKNKPPKRAEDAQAEATLLAYQEGILRSLGPLRDDAERLLGEHLVNKADGTRNLIKADQACAALPKRTKEEVARILTVLENGAILRAQAQTHDQTQFYELGHDWLAGSIHRQRRAKEGRRAVWMRLGAAVVVVGAVAVAAYWSHDSKIKAERASVNKFRDKCAQLEKDAEAARTAARARVIGGLLWAHDLLDANRADVAALVLAEIDPDDDAFRVPGDEAFKSLVADTRNAWISTAFSVFEHQPARATLHGPDDPVTRVRPSPDGELLLLVFLSGAVSLERADGRTPPPLGQAADGAIEAAWNPAHPCFATAGKAGKVTLRPKADPARALIQKHGDGELVDVSFDAPGTHLITASADGTARVWALDDTGCAFAGEPVEVPHGGPVDLAGVTSGKEGTVAFTAGQPAKDKQYGQLKVWSIGLAGAKLLWKYDGPERLHGGVRRVAFRADGATLLAIPGQSRAIWLAGVRDGASRGELPGRESVLGSASQVEVSSRLLPEQRDSHIEPVMWADFEPSGGRVVTTSWDGTARIWSGALGRKDLPSFLLSAGPSAVSRAAWSPDGTMVVTTAQDRVVAVWRVPAPADRSKDAAYEERRAVLVRRARTSSEPGGLFFPSASSKRFVTRGVDGSVQVWDTESAGAATARFDDALRVTSRHVVQRAPDGSIQLQPLAAGAPPLRTPFTGPVLGAAVSPNGARAAVLQEGAGGWEAVLGAAVSPDGARAAVLQEGAGGWEANLWKVGEPVRTVRLPGKPRQVELSDGDTALVLGEDGRLARLNANGSLSWPLEGGEKRLPVTFAALAADGKRLLYIEKDQSFARYKVLDSTDDLALWGKGNTRRASAAVFGPDPSTLLSISRDGIAVLWTLNPTGTGIDAGKLPLSWTALPGSAVCGAFAPSGQRIAIGSNTGRLAVLDRNAVTASVTFQARDAPLVEVAFVSETALVTRDAVHRAALWSLSPSDLRGRLREAVSQCLSKEQRMHYLQEKDAEAQEAFDTCNRRSVAADEALNPRLPSP